VRYHPEIEDTKKPVDADSLFNLPKGGDDED